MNDNSRSGSRAYWGRTGAALIAGALAASGIAAALPASGSPPDDLARLKAEAEIEELTYCYAEATDAIGRGELEYGRSLYKKCFTSDGVLEAYYPGDDPNGPPSLTSDPSAWADVANNEFTTKGYVSTQHLNANVRIDVKGNWATMSTYLSATHVIDPTGAIDLAHGTYEDIVVRTPKGWKIKKRTLRLLTYMRVESP
ncbi:nuclear transport factor 2 family protein [Polyangium aurulentum]|uniref:nuclear transport factor 2 family protein n=1 Tax=Polyangium aurulentum TaxID=2567896 RepID=UPI0010AECC97|nr:nuclear transport factor 2 family protein [Polyangium aurulentum]UQA58621.1 nuclear transport factor 2 family protein [Polyangium aurulentum]